MKESFSLRYLLFVFSLFCGIMSTAQVVNVGSGSYTQTFPGVDAAGRNGYPSGTPYTIGNAATKPTPTNDWWSAKVKNAHCDNLFNYPFTLKTLNQGLLVTYIPWGPIDNIEPVIVGVSGLNANAANVSDFSDWTVEMDWANGAHHFQTTTGIGMPFLYFSKASSDVAQITVNQGTVTISNEMLLIVDARNGADFAVYAPTGSVWTQTGNVYTSTLNGQNYWSLGFIPLNAGNPSATANLYKKYAYVFPTNTHTDWNYDENTSVVHTDFEVEVDVKEGTDSLMLMGLLPHQWDNLSSPQSFTAHTYPTVRGELKTMESNSFSVENTFYGILPTLPYIGYYSNGYSPAKMNDKIGLLENDALNPWTDSYNEGQEMNRLIQTARVAELSGDSVAFNKLLSTVKERLEDWLKVQANEVAFLFYYNQTWSAMIGYPAGHGQDNNINDHHFHWGYFIHAASFLEQFEPGWAAQWGDMVNLLVRDAASTNRNDNLFPFLRNFSPYAGHCWANGFATFPQGNDQESTSESMQFNSSLIHWGSVTGNDSIRDLGIYLYTTEQSAVEEYWFDKYDRNFGPNQAYSLVSRVWGNSYDNGTFWTADIAASYGIELYPIHGGSLYLGHDTNYVKQLWAEMEQNTGILTNDPNVNLWHDEYWKYLSFIDPEKALMLYDSYPERSLKFGVTDVQTYHWLHSMNVLGHLDMTITSNHPMAVAFNNDGDLTYVAQNYGDNPIVVTFSDGFTLNVPANKLVTSKDISLEGQLSTSFLQAYPGGSVDLSVQVSGGNATLVEFYDGDSLIGSTTQAPYTLTAANLTVGRHPFYARIYDGNRFAISNIVRVVVGEQLPYTGTPFAIPGDFDAAHYDIFEGGVGNGIAYQDLSINNEGNFRTDEYVDAATTTSEGDMVGWISPGEWLEYTIDVQQAGNYTLNLRYASGNSAGGGPFDIESDGLVVSSNNSVSSTSNWNTWATKTVANIPLKSGIQVLRLSFNGGEMNIANLNFTYDSPLSYNQPVADAGINQVLVLPQSNTSLDGSGSFDPASSALSYKWTQVYGPSILQISNDSIAQPSISTLIEGVYLLKLEVDNGSYSDEDEVYIISSLSSNISPKVSIRNPVDNAEFYENADVLIEALSSDLNDSVVRIDFYLDGQNIGSDSQEPFDWTWTAGLAGNYVLSAVAFDSYGDSTISAPVNLDIVEAPACEQSSWNGDFNYRFSTDQNDPTITFIPSQAGVGTPTCILYYGTDPGNMPGYIVSPNVPFQINASSGTRIYFYYTYSFPGAGERNNAANKDEYIVGSCQNIGIQENDLLMIKAYPNPVSQYLHIEWVGNIAQMQVYQLNGVLVESMEVAGTSIRYDMSSLPKGLYFFKMVIDNQIEVFKVLKD
jgi:endoglucanase Acf2